MEPKLIKGDIAVDDRGILSFVNDFNFADVKRFYIVENHGGQNVRGWHGHKREAKYALVTKGWAIFVAKPLEDDKDSTLPISKYALSSSKPEILYIPAGYFHAFQTRTHDTQVMFFSTATLEQSKADDVRKQFTLRDLELFNVEIR